MSGRFGSIDSQYFDDNGDPLAFGKLEFYENGTSTRKATYSDAGYQNLNPWPVILDGAGVPPDIFIQGEVRTVLQAADGEQQRVHDASPLFLLIITNGPRPVDTPDDAPIEICVQVAGDPADYTYQWYRAGVLIPGATEQCYWFIPECADDGVTYRVDVTGSGVTQSASVTISVECICTAYEPNVSAVDLTWLWASDVNLGTGGVTIVEGWANRDSLIVVKDDVILQQYRTDLTFNPGRILYSGDFGVSAWVERAIPVDINWQTRDPTSYQRQIDRGSYQGMQVDGNTLYIQYGYTESGGVSGSVFKSTDWGLTSIPMSYVRRLANDPTDSENRYKKLELYSYHIGLDATSEGEIVMAGRPSGVYVGFQVLGERTIDIPGVNTINPGLHWTATNVAANSPEGAGFQCYRLQDGWTWHSGEQYWYCWASDPDHTGEATPGAAYWNGGTSDWRQTATGSWRATGQGNGNWSINGHMALNTEQLNDGWETDYKTVLIPYRNSFDPVHANLGKYCWSSVPAGVPTLTEIDYSSLLTAVEVDDGLLTTFKLRFAKAAGKWVIIYAFHPPASGASPDHFYVRVAGSSYQVADFGPPLRVNLPGTDLLETPGRTAYVLDFSRSQDKWVISTFRYDGGSFPQTYRQCIGCFDDVFECPP